MGKFVISLFVHLVTFTLAAIAADQVVEKWMPESKPKE